MRLSDNNLIIKIPIMANVTIVEMFWRYIFLIGKIFYLYIVK